MTNAETGAVNLGVGQATQNLPEAASALQGPLNFFQTLLSGNRGAVMEALSPSIASLTSEYDTGRKTEEQFAPRGGGRAATLATQPTTEAGQIAGLVNSAQQTGAAGVSEIAQLLGQLGLGELGIGTSTAASTFNQEETAKENEQQQGAQAGQAIGSLIALLAA